MMAMTKADVVQMGEGETGCSHVDKGLNVEQTALSIVALAGGALGV
jgi:hypothetical protein